MRCTSPLLAAVLCLVALALLGTGLPILGASPASAQTPDIVARSLSLSPLHPVAGQAVTLTAVIANQGNFFLINNFYCEFLTTKNNVRTRIVEKSVTNDLAVGDSLILTATWTASAVDSVVFVADNRRWVPELNESNNVKNRAVQIALPDFAVTQVRLSPVEQILGRSQGLLARVTNLGLSVGDSVNVCFTVDGVGVGCMRIASVAGGDTASVIFPSWTAAAGSHVIRAVADSTQAWGETSETNNALSRKVTVPRPDLAVKDIQWTPLSPAVGETVTVRAEFVNRGSGGFGNDFNVRFDIDGAWSAITVHDDAPLGARAPAFSGADFESGNLTSWTTVSGWSAALQPGNPDSTSNRYLARAASGGAVLESPTFVVTDSTLTFRGRSLVSIFPGTFEVRSTGGALLLAQTFSTGPSDSWLAFALDVSRYLGQAVKVRITTTGGGAEVDDIRTTRAPGSSVLVAFAKQVWVGTAGSHMFAITADDGDAVPETDETNNTRREYLDQGPGDYRITALRTSVFRPVIGRPLPFLVTVQNFGASQGAASQVCLTVDGSPAGCATMNGLAQGQSVEVSVPGWTAVPGSHSVQAQADATGTIIETNEANNGSSTTVTVQNPDLVVYDIRWVPEYPADGDSVTVWAEIGNQGPGGAVGTYRVRMSSTAEDSTVAVYDDVALGLRGQPFANANFESGDFTGWTDALYWSIEANPGDGAVTRDKFYAHTDSSSAVLSSNSFVVTDSTLSFRGATPFNLRPATFQVRRLDGQILASTLFSGTSARGWDWQAHALDLSTHLGDTVTVRVITNSGGARVDDVRLGPDPVGSQVVTFPTWRWMARVGAPRLEVQVDALGEIPETNESNNMRAEDLVPGLVDLRVAGLRLSPGRVVAGHTVPLLARVRNDGASTSRTSRVCFDVDGAPAGCVQTPGLAHGEERDVAYFGWVSSPGAHAVVARADGQNEITESNEGNNALTASLALPLPDLKVRSIFWVPAIPDSGDSVTIYAEIENRGEGGNAASYQVGLSVDSYNLALIVRDDVGIGQIPLAFTNAGFESGVWTRWNLHSGWTFYEHPTLYGRSNNLLYARTLSGSKTLQSAPFVVTDSTLSFRGATGYGIWPATFLVCRAGGQVLSSVAFASSVSGAWDWQSYSLDVSAALGDTVYIKVVSNSGGARVDDVCMGVDPAAVTVVTLVSRVWVATQGTHRVSCTVDAGDVIPELNEENNSLSVPLVNTFSLCPVPVRAVPGDTVEIPLVVYGVDRPPLTDLGFDVAFDASDLSYLGAGPGPFTQSWTFSDSLLEAGHIRIHLTAPAPAVPHLEAILALVRFATSPGGQGVATLTVIDPTGDLASAVSCPGEVEFVAERTGIPADGGTALALGAAFPNPFRTAATVEFSVPQGAPTRIRIAVFNVQGQLVRTLVDDEVASGTHRVEWRGDSDRGEPLAPGLYFAVMQGGSFRAVQKMIRLR